jgi:hypothetical protein
VSGVSLDAGRPVKPAGPPFDHGLGLAMLVRHGRQRALGAKFKVGFESRESLVALAGLLFKCHRHNF